MVIMVIGFKPLSIPLFYNVKRITIEKLLMVIEKLFLYLSIRYFFCNNHCKRLL